jgi:hypothetical protein
MTLHGTRTRHRRRLFQVCESRSASRLVRQTSGRRQRGESGTMFRWSQPESPANEDVTAWCIFPASTKYFGENKIPFMLNYVVDDLHATFESATSGRRLGGCKSRGIRLRKIRLDHGPGRESHRVMGTAPEKVLQIRSLEIFGHPA